MTPEREAEIRKWLAVWSSAADTAIHLHVDSMIGDLLTELDLFRCRVKAVLAIPKRADLAYNCAIQDVRDLLDGK